MNTHEQYVSFETAKLLKRAGFDWEVEHYYNTLSSVKEPIRGMYDRDYNSFGDEFYSAPTQAVAMRWLREVKDIDVEVMRCIDVKVYNAIYVYHGETIIIKHLPTYEEAAEAGIQECLKVILNEQEQ